MGSSAINKQNGSCFYIPKRLIVAVLGFLGIFMNYVIRGNLSVAIVAMNASYQHNSTNETVLISECPAEIYIENGTADRGFIGEQFHWDPISRSTIMTAYFYSYFVTVLTGGYLAERVGAAKLFGGGVFLASLLCFCIPAAARGGLGALVVTRSIQGLCGGVVLPSMSAVVSRWSPKLERSVMTTVIFTGSIMSNVIANPISGYLTTIDFLGGWPSIFYLSGLCGCIWYILWFSLVYETPRLHPSITEDELLHFPEENVQLPKQKHEVPWKAIATSLPFWSVLLAQSGVVFATTILYTELPSYISKVLHFNIKASGALSTLPYIAESIAAWVSSFAADKMRATGKWRITTIRKIFNSLAGYTMSACFLGITFCGCDSSLIMTLLTVGMFFEGFKFSGFHATTIDMSTDFAGTLYGLEYGASSLFGITGPAMVGAFTVSGATVKNWSKVFYVTAAIKFATTTFYAVFASAEPQPWGKARSKDLKSDEIKT